MSFLLFLRATEEEKCETNAFVDSGSLNLLRVSVSICMCFMISSIGRENRNSITAFMPRHDLEAELADS